ncbi:protein S40-4 [Silene latifolia]|uniref:protein S40-4 n=1 Tax=Silene latifolia TaxID=37657 RepID=UPI003D778125
MASAKSFMRATNYRFLSTDTAVVRPGHGHTNSFEFDESDVWGGLTQSNSTDIRNPPLCSRRPIASPRKRRGGEAMSVPVNVPDWSKILREEYKDKLSAGNIDSAGDYDGGVDVGGDDEWVPPHEYLSKTRNASFSMQEGVGRTLKGRDLSRVRNAIWEKTGFQD